LLINHSFLSVFSHLFLPDQSNPLSPKTDFLNLDAPKANRVDIK
jgi:hypothetical protein